MKIERREWLALGGLAVGAAGFSQTVKHMVKGATQPKDETLAQFDAHSLKPEFTVDAKTGDILMNPEQKLGYTVCMGCTTLCGVRVRVDQQSGQVLRVNGNPYNPHSTLPHLPMKATVKESLLSVSGFKGQGNAQRSTTCGRGHAVMEHVNSPYRVLTPMKRVGSRNSGKWEPISFEQLIKEVVEGGDLFGEGHVDGLAALRDLKTPIHADAPEFGARVNQVGIFGSVNEGREAFSRRFWNSAYGTLNYIGHGSYCGGSYRSGSGALFGDMKKMPHAKPDFGNAEFILFIGTAPGQAGNPYKRTGGLVAEARAKGLLNYVVVDPVLNNSDNRASGDTNRWVPIKPGTDSALLMGMMRWMFENNRVNADYLAIPNQKAADALNEPSYTSGTYLVINNPSHPRCGRYLRGSDTGMTIEESKRYTEEDPYMVVNQSGQLVAAGTLLERARLLPEENDLVAYADLSLKTAFELLREAALRHSYEEYSVFCGVPEKVIQGLANEFSSHGRKASAITHGGMMSGNGFYNAFGVVTLNALIGSLNWKGGYVINGGGFPDAGAGPRYNLASFEGQITPKGMPLGRNVPYERTTEFKSKKEKGQAYPAKDAWFPNAPGLGTEWFPAAFRGYPYNLKALIFWMSNPVYGIVGLDKMAQKELADPKKIPLVIAIDPFINESSAYADYIVPDSVMYESWGWVAPWNGVPTKTMASRWPVVDPRTEKTPDGQPITMESFLIALAKAMELPGFGDKGLTDKDGNPVPLNTAEDWYMRGGANIAFAGGNPVADATDEDIDLSGVDKISPMLKEKLKPEEWRKVALLYSRGGRYQSDADAQDANNPEWQTHRFKNTLWLWNENLGSSKNSLTGKRFWGTPQWQAPAFATGAPMRDYYPEEEWPLLLVSYKSAMHSSYSIGTSLTTLQPRNQIIMHPVDAEKIGVTTGDEIRITTPGGEKNGIVTVHSGVMAGVVGIEHGYGHKELGARAHTIGDVQQPVRPQLKAGMNINELGIMDPTRGNEAIWVDAVSGACVRTGLPAKVVRA